MELNTSENSESLTAALTEKGVGEVISDTFETNNQVAEADAQANPVEDEVSHLPLESEKENAKGENGEEKSVLPKDSMPEENKQNDEIKVIVDHELKKDTEDLEISLVKNGDINSVVLKEIRNGEADEFEVVDAQNVNCQEVTSMSHEGEAVNEEHESREMLCSILNETESFQTFPFLKHNEGKIPNRDNGPRQISLSEETPGSIINVTEATETFQDREHQEAAESKEMLDHKLAEQILNRTLNLHGKTIDSESADVSEDVQLMEAGNESMGSIQYNGENILLLNGPDGVINAQSKIFQERENDKTTLSDIKMMTQKINEAASKFLYLKEDSNIFETLENIYQYTLTLKDTENSLKVDKPLVKCSGNEMLHESTNQLESANQEGMAISWTNDGFVDTQGIPDEIDLEYFKQEILDLEAKFKLLVKESEVSQKRVIELSIINIISESQCKDLEKALSAFLTALSKLHTEHIHKQTDDPSKVIDRYYLQANMYSQIEVDVANQFIDLKEKLLMQEKVIQQTELEAMRLNEKLDCLIRSLDKSKYEAQNMYASAARVEIEPHSANEKIRELNVLFEDLQKKLIVEKENNHNCVADLNEKLNSLQDTLDKFNFEAENMLVLTTEMEIESLLAYGKIAEMNVLLGDLQKKLTEEKHKNHNQVADLNVKLDLLKASFDRSNHEVENMFVSATRMEIESLLAYSKIAELDVLVGDLQDKLMEERQNNCNCVAELNNMAKKNLNLNSELQGLMGYIHELEKGIDLVKNENQTAKLQFKSMAKGINAVLDKLVLERHALHKKVSILVNANHGLERNYLEREKEKEVLISKYKNDLKKAKENEEILSRKLQSLKIVLNKYGLNVHLPGLQEQSYSVESNVPEQELTLEGATASASDSSFSYCNRSIVTSSIIESNTKHIADDQTMSVNVYPAANSSLFRVHATRWMLIILVVSVLIGLFIAKVS